MQSLCPYTRATAKKMGREIKENDVRWISESANYRLYDVETSTIKIFRNVTFNEKSEHTDISSENKITLPLYTSDPGRENKNDNVQQKKTEIGNIEKLEDKETMKTLYEDIGNNSKWAKPHHNHNDRTLIKKPEKYEANFTELIELLTYEEIVTESDAKKWKEAIREKLDAHIKNHTW